MFYDTQGHSGLMLDVGGFKRSHVAFPNGFRNTIFFAYEDT